MKPSGTARCASPMRASSDLSTAVNKRCGMVWSVSTDLLGSISRFSELADLVEHPLQLALVVAQRVLGLFDGDVTTADEGFGVGLADAALGVDDVVHVRLRHRRVVAPLWPRRR